MTQLSSLHYCPPCNIPLWASSLGVSLPDDGAGQFQLPLQSPVPCMSPLQKPDPSSGSLHPGSVVVALPLSPPSLSLAFSVSHTVNFICRLPFCLPSSDSLSQSWWQPQSQSSVTGRKGAWRSAHPPLSTPVAGGDAFRDPPSNYVYCFSMNRKNVQ